MRIQANMLMPEQRLAYGNGKGCNKVEQDCDVLTFLHENSVKFSN